MPLYGFNLRDKLTRLPPVELNSEMRSLRLAFAHGPPGGRHRAKARQKQSSLPKFCSWRLGLLADNGRGGVSNGKTAMDLLRPGRRWA